MKVSYDWLKDYIGNTDLSPEDIEALLTFHSFEIEGVEKVDEQFVIDVDVLPNRSSDCLCHRGIARELATITGVPLEQDPLAEVPELTPTDVLRVEIEDEKACPRFTASLITGIEVKESPEWLQARLKAIGQRPINNIVDATNYVMFAIGQPIHAYDADLFPQADGAWQFGVRYAQKGEVVSLIAEGGKDEERDVTLTGTELLIVDNASDTPIGLAGVKGGRFAGVHAGTTKIIIEAAHFDPILTRKTARGLGIVIDASKRFENEPSRELPPYAQREIIKLITDIAGGTCEGTVDEYLEKATQVRVKVSVSRANALLGLSLSQDEMSGILGRAGCALSMSEDTITAIGPWERTDLIIEEDFIEEIGRVYGYDKVASVVPETVPLTEINARHYYSEQVRSVLLAEGFSEVITSSFRNKDEVQLLNALASDKSYMRSSLISNLTEVLDKNAGFTDLLGSTDTRVFEIGTVFYNGSGKDGLQEHVSLALGVRQKASGYTNKDDALLESILANIEQKLNTTLKCTTEKGVAEINFTEVIAGLPVPTAYEPVVVAEEIVYTPFSIYPAMTRDIALWVTEGTTIADVEKVLNRYTGDLCVRTTHVDEFTKDGRTSHAFRLVFQSYEKTLTDNEVNGVMDGVYTAVAERGWEVR